jgi:exopolysaccharide biosynthesis polyprenyl glycosylphosphotransferase
MRCGRGRNVDFRVLPDLFNCLPKKTEVQQLGPLPLIKLFEEPLEGLNRFFKRAVDLALSMVIIAGTSPIWATVMILLKLDSKGPLFYIQERVGMDGRPFGMYKFRSMYINQDDSKHRAIMEAAIKNASVANQGDEERPVFGKVKDDPRITRVGRFIRKYSIDELPQLINVVRGEMSLVGPRPPIPYEVEMYEDWHRSRFHATPGLTGLWQVSGRNRLTFDEMVRLDVYYLKNWSIWLDLKILLKTPMVVLKGDDAY